VFDVMTADPVGRLTGSDRPLEGPTATADTGSIALEVALDALAMARGIHAMGDPAVSEIMAY
jgi:hypothetical protein